MTKRDEKGRNKFFNAVQHTLTQCAGLDETC